MPGPIIIIKQIEHRDKNPQIIDPYRTSKEAAMLTKDHTEEFVNTGARFISLIHSSATESVL